MSFVAILHNIRSAYNAGACFRTADGAGMEKVFLTGYTPRPARVISRQRLDVDKLYPVYFTKAEKEIAKTALGAEKNILWEKYKRLAPVLKQLKQEGFEIVALEQSKKSIDYRDYKPKRKVALLAGNEVRGIDNQILKQCDKIIVIPMKGKKESLNVSVAFGIASFDIAGKMKRRK